MTDPTGPDVATVALDYFVTQTLLFSVQIFADQKIPSQSCTRELVAENPVACRIGIA